MKRKQEETGDQAIEGSGMTAYAAVQDYFTRPLCDDTFEFWKSYSMSTERAHRCLAELARKYLTPPPTTTGRNAKSWTYLRITLAGKANKMNLPCRHNFFLMRVAGNAKYHFTLSALNIQTKILHTHAQILRGSSAQG